MIVEEWLSIFIDSTQDEKDIRLRAITFIREIMEDNSFTKNYPELTLLYLAENRNETRSISRKSSVPVYGWILITSSFTLLASFFGIYKLRKKAKKDVAIQNEEESYSDVSFDWSSNYNSQLWEQYDDSCNTPKRTNIKQIQ